MDGATTARATGRCAANAAVATSAGCHAAAVAELGTWGIALGNITVRTGSDASMPAGCSVTVQTAGSLRPQAATAFFNTATADTAAACGSTKPLKMFGAVKGNRPAQPVGVWVSANATHLEITATGPSRVWFGVGLNATVMGAKPWTLVVDGTGAVSEHQLGNHIAGTVLPKSVTVVESRTSGGRRTVKVVRPMSTAHSSFDLGAVLENSQLPLISAVGSGAKFAYHKQKSVATVHMVALDAPTCLCSDPSAAVFGEGKGKLIYNPVAGEPGGAGSTVPGAPATSLGFAKDCRPYPTSTMLLEKNPSCDLRVYTGGQSCVRTQAIRRCL